MTWHFPIIPFSLLLLGVQGIFPLLSALIVFFQTPFHTFLQFYVPLKPPQDLAGRNSTLVIKHCVKNDIFCLVWNFFLLVVSDWFYSVTLLKTKNKTALTVLTERVQRDAVVMLLNILVLKSTIYFKSSS